MTKEPTTNATVTNSSEETTKAATYNSSRIWGSVCITTAATTVDTTEVALVGDEAVVSSWPIYDDMEAAFDQGQQNIYFTYLLGTFSLWWLYFHLNAPSIFRQTYYLKGFLFPFSFVERGSLAAHSTVNKILFWQKIVNLSPTLKKFFCHSHVTIMFMKCDIC